MLWSLLLFTLHTFAPQQYPDWYSYEYGPDMILTHIDSNKSADREPYVRQDVQIDWEMPPPRQTTWVDCGEQLWYKDTADQPEWRNPPSD